MISEENIYDFYQKKMNKTTIELLKRTVNKDKVIKYFKRKSLRKYLFVRFQLYISEGNTIMI